MPGYLPRTNEQVTGCARSFAHPQVRGSSPLSSTLAVTTTRSEFPQAAAGTGGLIVDLDVIDYLRGVHRIWSKSGLRS
jgi:hypothetical protein